MSSSLHSKDASGQARLTALYNEGVKRMQCGQLKHAVLLLRKAAFFSPDDLYTTLALGECYTQLCDLQSAVVQYRRAVWLLHRLNERCGQRLICRQGAGACNVGVPRSGYDDTNDAHPDQTCETAMMRNVLCSIAAPPSLLPAQKSPVRTPYACTKTPPVHAADQATLNTLRAQGQIHPTDEQHAHPLPQASWRPSGQLSSVPPPLRSSPSISSFALPLSPSARTQNNNDSPHTSHLAAHDNASWTQGSHACKEEKENPAVQEIPHALPSQMSPVSFTPHRENDDPAACAELLAQVRCRLVGLLDALGLTLFQLADYTQALRFIHEALALATATATEGAIDTPTPTATQSHACLRGVLLLHRCVCLIALGREEEAEYQLQDHVTRYPALANESAALLVYLFANRHSFRTARELIVAEERRYELAACEHAQRNRNEARDTHNTHTTSEGDVPDSLSAQQQQHRQQHSAEGEEPNGQYRYEHEKQHCFIIARHIFHVKYYRHRHKTLALRDVSALSRCLEVYPNDVELLFARAQLYIAQGEPKKSVKDLFLCVQETNGRHKRAVDTMTSVLFSIGSSLDGESGLREAVAYYSESLKWSPANADVLRARGDCHARLNNISAALQDYHRALQLNDGDDLTRCRIARMHDWRGCQKHAEGQLAEAEEEFTRAIATDDSQAVFYYHRAQCRFALHETRYALRDVLSCQKLNPPEPVLQAFTRRYLDSHDIATLTTSIVEAPLSGVRSRGKAAKCVKKGSHNKLDPSSCDVPMLAASSARGVDSPTGQQVRHDDGQSEDARTRRAAAPSCRIRTRQGGLSGGVAERRTLSKDLTSWSSHDNCTGARAEEDYATRAKAFCQVLHRRNRAGGRNGLGGRTPCAGETGVSLVLMQHHRQRVGLPLLEHGRRRGDGLHPGSTPLVVLGTPVPPASSPCAIRKTKPHSVVRAIMIQGRVRNK